MVLASLLPHDGPGFPNCTEWLAWCGPSILVSTLRPHPSISIPIFPLQFLLPFCLVLNDVDALPLTNVAAICLPTSSIIIFTLDSHPFRRGAPPSPLPPIPSVGTSASFVLSFLQTVPVDLGLYSLWLVIIFLSLAWTHYLLILLVRSRHSEASNPS